MRNSSEIILCTLGTRGDVEPFLLLGKELQEAGWPVTLLSNANWGEAARRLGISFRSIGPADQTQSGRDDYQFFVQDVLPTYRTSFDFIRERHEAGASPAVIYRSNMLGAQCAAVKFELHRIKLVLQPGAIKSLNNPPWPLSRMPSWLGQAPKRKIASILFWAAEHHSPYRRHTHAFRRSVGLSAKVQWQDACGRDNAVLLLCPAWFALPQSDWPSNLYLTGFPLTREIAPDLAIEDFIKRNGPPIVFTPGTGIDDTGAFFEKAAAIIRATGHSALFLSKRIPEKYRTTPAVLCRDYAPLGGLLRHAAALVHHGGIGTTAEALRAGCPQIIVPNRFDQPDNAVRIARLGLGAAVMSDRLHVNAWKELLKKMLTSPHIRLQLATARALVAEEDGVRNALSVIEHALGAAPDDSVKVDVADMISSTCRKH